MLSTVDERGGLDRLVDRDHGVEHVVGQRALGAVRAGPPDRPRHVQHAGAARRTALVVCRPTASPRRRAPERDLAVEHVRVGEQQRRLGPGDLEQGPRQRASRRRRCSAPTARTRTGPSALTWLGTVTSNSSPAFGPEPITRGLPGLRADRAPPRRPDRTSGPARSGSTGRCRTAARRPPGTGRPGSGARTPGPGDCIRISAVSGAPMSPALDHPAGGLQAAAEERVGRAADPQPGRLGRGRAAPGRSTRSSASGFSFQTCLPAAMAC